MGSTIPGGRMALVKLPTPMALLANTPLHGPAATVTLLVAKDGTLEVLPGN